MTVLQFHKIANIFPLIEGDEFSALVDDIRAHGLHNPIVLYEDRILDGRNRYRACEAAGVEARAEHYSGDDPVGYVLSLNLNRRHLDTSQRAMIHARIATLPKGANQHTAIAVPSQEEAAKLLNVSVDSGQRARSVIEGGDENLIHAVEIGELSVSAAADITAVSKEEQAEIATLVKRGEQTYLEAAKAIRNKTIRGTFGTGENEWYTPAEYVDYARQVLGVINLDPASNTVAQQTVKAESFFTAQDSGLDKEWHGNVWLNPPYSHPLISEFVSKLVAELRAGRVKQAIMLTNNYTDTAWFHEAFAVAAAICFTRGRIRFVSPSGEQASPIQGSALFYFGDNVGRFEHVFGEHGAIALPSAMRGLQAIAA